LCLSLRIDDFLILHTKLLLVLFLLFAPFNQTVLEVVWATVNGLC
jgi:hypothetical protein